VSPTSEGYPTSAFDYDLPPERIAQHPSARRDESRLLVLERATARIQHRIFRDIAELIPAGDALVLNETRVFPARLVGRRAGGGEAEVLLLRAMGQHHGAAGRSTPEDATIWGRWCARARS
jgi:S-adenosylmethionine:tRNA ribosyltransferase-isomerase